MNKELKFYLKKETTEELFYNFKHDGLLNFEKKLMSGAILFERKYSTHKLRKEKSKIINDIKSTIATYNNKETLVEKKKKSMNRNILWGILGLPVSLLPVGLDYIYGTSFSGKSILFSSLIYLFFVLLNVLNYNKRIQKYIKDSEEDSQLLKSRLQLIENYWDF